MPDPVREPDQPPAPEHWTGPAPGPPRRRGRPALGAQRRTAILDAVRSAAVERGLPAVTLRDVARRAGVSPALLVYHFGSRSGLMLAALEAGEPVLPAPDRTAWAAVLDVVESSLPTGPGDAQWQLWLAAQAVGASEPDVAAALTRITDAWVDRLARAIRAGVASGEFRPVPVEDACDVLSALVDGLAAEVVNGLRGTDRDRMRALLLDVVHRYLDPAGQPSGASINLNTVQ